MKCNKAELAILGGKPMLVLECDHEEIKDFLERTDGQFPMDIEITKKRKRRSLDANSYCWVLADKIARAVGITKEEVYRSHIRDVGVFTDVCVTEEASEEYMQKWEEKGLGWIAEELPYCKIPKCKKIRTYYGSSSYDTKEMSHLIDNLIYEAKGLGIETLTPSELERMMNQWGTH